MKPDSQLKHQLYLLIHTNKNQSSSFEDHLCSFHSIFFLRFSASLIPFLFSFFPLIPFLFSLSFLSSYFFFHVTLNFLPPFFPSLIPFLFSLFSLIPFLFSLSFLPSYFFALNSTVRNLLYRVVIL